jgi:3-phenylpropionate/cinnamic acid dioxygenase small subunit
MASTPPPRTCHLVTGVMIDEANAEQVRAAAQWQTISFSEQTGQRIRSGSYEYVLRRDGASFRIAQKKILLLEHVIDGYFDIYMIWARCCRASIAPCTVSMSACRSHGGACDRETI